MKTKHGTITTAGPLMRAWLKLLGGKTGFAAPEIRFARIGPTAYIHPDQTDNLSLIAHEDCHLRQAKELGFWRYCFQHIYNNITVGYKNNPLEEEARKYAKENWHKYTTL